MTNLLLLLIGSGSVYLLFQRLRDYFFSSRIAATENKIASVDTGIQVQNTVIKSDEQTAQEKVDDYEKLKSDSTNGGTSN